MSKKRRRRRRRGNWFTRLSLGKKIALCTAGVFLLLIAAIIIFVALKFSKINTVDIPMDEIVINDMADDVGEGYTNFVLFGGDSRTGELGVGVRTDTIIVVSLNNKTKEVKLVSVYRDTLLDLSDGSLRKCNAAYSNGGPKQAINMLNMNLDLDITKYVTVDFTAVAEVIDLLGGIEVDVSPAEMAATNRYIAETARVAGKKANYLTHSGLQTLDGVQATTYARIRKGVGDDYQRTERQRLVVQKVFEKVKKADLLTINNIIDKIFPAISTNFTMTEILSYAKNITKYKIVETDGFPSSKTSQTIPGKGSCVIPITLKDNVQALHNFLYGTIDYQPSSKVNSISNEIQYIVGNLTPDVDVPYTDPSGNTGSDEPDAPIVNDPNNGETTPGTGEGGETTPGTGEGGETTPGTGEGGETTPGTGEGGETTPGTGEGGETTPGTGEGGETTPGTGEGGETTPGTGEGGETTPDTEGTTPSNDGE